MSAAPGIHGCKRRQGNAPLPPIRIDKPGCERASGQEPRSVSDGERLSAAASAAPEGWRWAKPAVRFLGAVFRKACLPGARSWVGKLGGGER